MNIIGRMLRTTIMFLAIKHVRSTVADRISISLGTVSLIPRYSWTPGILIENADKMLFEAKADGRNRVKSMVLE